MKNINQKIRLAKYIAQCCKLSRRSAEQAIIDGRICVNSIPILHPLYFVSEGDFITLDRKIIEPPKTTILAIYHKRPFELVTYSDPEKRQTVFDNISWPEDMRCISIGRLDYLSEGLLLLTNTPLIAHVLEKSRFLRCYHVGIYGSISEKALNFLKNGACIHGTYYRPCQIDILDKKGTVTWISITLDEGRNREIRRMMEYTQMRIHKLIRVSFGPISLGALASGEVAYLSLKHVRSLLDQIQSKSICAAHI